MSSPAEIKTVLLVDDDLAVRKMVRVWLVQSAFAVIEASNGEEALTLFRRHPEIDLLLTDVLMPGMTGMELARNLLLLRPGLPMLFMSGYHEKDERHAVRGFTCLRKPFEPRELIHHIRRLLGYA